MKTRLGGKSDLEVCRVINGLCQGPLDDTSADATDALRVMDRLAEAGLTTFQLGNAAGGGRALAERRAGSYLKSAAGAASGSREVRFLNTLTLRRGVPVTRKAVKAALELSLRRMGVERLDLVQLCWRDFEDRYFLDALYYLEEAECVSNVGVCAFPSSPLALAGANGFTIVSNLVASSLIKAPPGGAGGGAGSTTLERQCREQGVAMISSSGASLGGFAADEWAYRTAPSTGGRGEDGLSLDSRQALSDIMAWGSRGGGGGGGHDDAWRLYQTTLLPVLQAVARKHGRGLTPADVGTAFHLCRTRPPSPPSAGYSPGTTAGATGCCPGGGTEVVGGGASSSSVENSAVAVTVPVRVGVAGSLSARRLAEAEGDRVAGRRGAELAEMLDTEDVERVAAAVGEGAAVSAAVDPEDALSWERELLGGAAGGGGEEEGEGEELWGVAAGLDGPRVFL